MFLNTGLKITTLMMVFSLSACIEPTATQQPEAVSVPASAAVDEISTAPNPIVTTNFGGGSFRWSATAGFVYRYTAIERNGEVFICGVNARRGTGILNRFSREALQQASVVSNGRTILRNLTFFNTVSNANWGTRLMGTETACKSTGRSVDDVPLGSISIHFREGRYNL
ncbi:hypothetical protein L0666_15765 [Octadecabacter sp. CECT 8868]|uniref:hypothetical protein n=1 Tax=Octadecabacter algicola TaxID=2909342 RepID=UPI001F251623|nr:hypothetical protein [Octadecabacter algicola]MCF2906449.1 hypothetical protein [Octadecabacter algicola]